MHDFLANPVWSALSTTHASFAHTSDDLKRFPADVAPFCAVEHAGCALGAIGCMQAGEAVFFLGAAPALPAGWMLENAFQVLQMVYDVNHAPDLPAGENALLLEPGDAPAMLALAALAYPEFFRSRTCELGHYIGVHGEGGLDAMAGQRLACTGYREISAVVTHPAQRGHGHARRLITQLTRMILTEGTTPYLHVSASNKRARTLYEHLGFAPIRELRALKVRIA